MGSLKLLIWLSNRRAVTMEFSGPGSARPRGPTPYDGYLSTPNRIVGTVIEIGWFEGLVREESLNLG